MFFSTLLHWRRIFIDGSVMAWLNEEVADKLKNRIFSGPDGRSSVMGSYTCKYPSSFQNLVRGCTFPNYGLLKTSSALIVVQTIRNILIDT